MMKKGLLTACDHDETKVVYPMNLLEGCPLCCESALREKKDKTIQSLVEEKYTKYGDGCGFLASDNCGQKVWVNNTSIALEQKDEEINQLKAELEDWRNREGAVCPEDVGFEEYIKVLTEKLKSSEGIKTENTDLKRKIKQIHDIVSGSFSDNKALNMIYEITKA